ncbi:MAG: ribonuclease III [Patescibacteria group bacterium]|nr:ribonuclease III [Patescibacteria group bacterium]
MNSLPKFKNQHLFEQSFVHRSYLNETKKKLSSNERLEFLGDSVISFVVSQYLFNKYPQFDEGILTNLRSLLVNTKSLAQCARELDFGKYLLLSKGEEESRGRQNQSLLADCFEAFVGALFLDQGINVVSEFLNKVLIPKAELYVKNKAFKDPKSLLQEKIQSQQKNSPVYKVINEQGPAHAKIFTVGVYIDKTLIGKGNGKSKQEAEESAAKEGLKFLLGKAIEKKSKF